MIPLQEQKRQVSQYRLHQAISAALLAMAVAVLSAVMVPEATRAQDIEYQTVSMLERYIGEGEPANTIDWCGTDTVTYLNEDQRKEFLISVKEGKLVDSGGSLFDTRDASSLHQTISRAIFVMDKHGSIYASKQHEYCQFHHSSFLSGAPVASAGEIEVERGLLKLISNQSGHYRPPLALAKQTIEELERQGAMLDGVVEDWFELRKKVKPIDE